MRSVHLLLTLMAGGLLFTGGASAYGTAGELCDEKPATIVGTEGPDTITGTPGDDVIVGLGGDDRIDGLAGNDSICGGSGNDEVLGGDGKDGITGDDGEDHLDGGADLDAIDGAAGNDSMVGGGGIDIAFYSKSTAGVTVDLAAGKAEGGEGSDTLAGFEVVFGSAYRDLLTGDEQVNYFVPGGGDDVVDGGAERDVIVFGEGKAVNVDLAAGRASGEASDTLTRVEDVVASEGSKLLGDARENYLAADLSGNRDGERSTIVGRGGNDALFGGSGPDILQGGPGDDGLDGQDNDDVVDGGSGQSDVVVYAYSREGVRVDLAKGSAKTQHHGSDRLSGFEKILGSPYKDVLIGGPASEAFFGGAGNDILNGRGGGDLLVGEAGSDQAVGGSATDYCIDSERRSSCEISAGSYASAALRVSRSRSLRWLVSAAGMRGAMMAPLRYALPTLSSTDDILNGKAGFPVCESTGKRNTITIVPPTDLPFVDPSNEDHADWHATLYRGTRFVKAAPSAGTDIGGFPFRLSPKWRDPSGKEYPKEGARYPAAGAGRYRWKVDVSWTLDHPRLMDWMRVYQINRGGKRIGYNKYCPVS
jgi:Ca2+-binding RTX toxin-like protein